MLTVDWFKQFDEEAIELPPEGRIQAYVVSERATTAFDGYMPHHHIVLKKLITTEEEAQLYFIQLLTELGKEVLQHARTLAKGGVPPTQWATENAKRPALVITLVAHLLSPSSVLLPKKQSDSAPQLSFWLDRYATLLFDNEFVHMARYVGLPPELKFWAD